MSESVIHTPGVFVWRELRARDLTASERFYGELFAWAFVPDPTDALARRVVSAGTSVGSMRAADGGPAGWLAHLSVEDVDGMAECAVEAGGQVARAPRDVAGLGRVAEVADPDGAAFALLRAAGGDPAVGGRPLDGTFCWETVTSLDVGRAAAFYQRVAGWRTEVGPSGPDVTVFMRGDMQASDLQAVGEGAPRWTSYVVVDDVDEALERAASLGASVGVPRSIASVGRVGYLTDPEGAHLGLYEPRL